MTRTMGASPGGARGATARLAAGLLVALGGLTACAAPTPPSRPAPASDAAASAPASTAAGALAAGAATAAASAAPTSASQAAAPTPARPLSIKLAVTDPTVSLIPNSVMWLAKDLGYFEREGLDVDLVEMSGTPLAIAALMSGQADVANIGVPEVIELVATDKADVRAVHSPNVRQYFLLAGNGDLRTPQDLKGRTFGVARVGSVDHTHS